MIVVRRVYQYLVAFVSLLMLAWGAGGLGQELVDALTTSGASTVIAGTRSRSEVAQNGALVLVGLVVWLLHWGTAGRIAMRELGERASALRRLYLYGTLAAMLLLGAGAAQDVLEEGLRLMIGGSRTPNATQPLRPLPWLVVAGTLWIYHRQVTVTDRRLAGEQGNSATLRRWYTYGVAFIALMLLLRNVTQLLRLTAEGLIATSSGTLVSDNPDAFAGASATALVALAVWLAHVHRWAVRPVTPDPS